MGQDLTDIGHIQLYTDAADYTIDGHLVQLDSNSMERTTYFLVAVQRR